MWTALFVGCRDDRDGGDDGSEDAVGSIDAAAAVDAAGSSPDGAPGGTQQLGQFCEILEGGGPYCASDLSCCDNENICREPADCQGSGGFIPCTQGSDCHNGVCCEIPSMTFCTKRSACSAYDGTEIP